MNINLLGSFPSPLYRGFDTEQYAREFVEQGVFYMHPLPYYCRIENPKRQDKDEGEGKLKFIMNRPVVLLDSQSLNPVGMTSSVGPVNYGISTNLRYVLCFHGPQVSRKHFDFKQYKSVVRLNQPMELVNDIVSYLKQHLDVPAETVLDCAKVRYDKGQLAAQPPDLTKPEGTRIAYAQKYPKDSADCEYRLVLTWPIALDFCLIKIKVNLSKKLEYAEMLWL